MLAVSIILRIAVGLFCFELVEHRTHRWRVLYELLYTEVIRLVVSKAQIVLRRQQCLFDFLKVRYGLVDFINSLTETFAGEPIVAVEALLERGHILLEMENVELLVSDSLKLLLVFK